MARLNEDSKRKPRKNLHGEAVRIAHESGLADWALAHGFIAPDGLPMIYSASQRRLVERARDREAWRWAVDQQGYTGTMEDWRRMPQSERDEYEAGAAGIPTA